MNTKENMYQNIANIRVEDFLLYYTKAYKRTNIKALTQLHEQFPETAELAIDEDYLDSLSDPSDYEYQYRHPILIDSKRMTQNRVLDMVAYLFGKHEAPNKYKQILVESIAYHDVFNYQVGRYQRDYDKTDLWDCFFVELPELRYILGHLPLYLLRETGSSTLFGIVTACSFLPMIVLSLLGGVLADRVNKRNIMVGLDFITAEVIAVFSWLLGTAPMIPLFITALMLLYGISGTYQPAVQVSTAVHK